MPAPVVDSESESAPADAEDAEAALARAEKDLDTSLGPSGRTGAAPRAEALKESPDAPCDTACRAFSSMQRAAGHLCSIAGDADARCGAARERLQRASERVRAACPACTATGG